MRPRFLARALLAVLASAIAVAAAAHALSGADGRHVRAAGAHGRLARWAPHPTTAPWQWQLQGRVDTSVEAAVYEVDGFETSKRTVRTLHRLHRRAICYVDVGSWESGRPDAGLFPRAVLGRRYAGYPDERWLDVSRFGLFAPVLRRRFAICARKGFDAVEPDNLTAWEPGNRTGFPISAADQLSFNRWVARQVHRLGMAVALKNDGRQARRLVGAFDFAVVEQCFQYRECGYFRGFVRRHKAVFEAEYGLAPRRYCRAARALGFSAIGKSEALRAQPWRPCPLPPASSRVSRRIRTSSAADGVTRPVA
jgi:hypothetical protein